jgi:chromosome segregation ATPase
MMTFPNEERPEQSVPAKPEDTLPADGAAKAQDGVQESDQDALTEAAEALAEQQEPELPSAGTLAPAGVRALSAEPPEDTTLDFIQSFNRQLDQIQEMKDSLEAETVELKKDIAARERTMAQLHRRLADLDQQARRVEALEREVQRLESVLETRDHDVEAAKAELRARDATLKQKDSFIAELNSSHDSLVQKTIELKEEIQKLKEERTQFKSQFEVLAGEKEDLLNEKRRIEQAMNQLDAKYQAAHDEVMSARKILGELQSAFETSQRKARAILDKKIRGSGS